MSLDKVVKVDINHPNFVLLKVTGTKHDILATGTLSGNEEYIRLTKGKRHVLTISPKDGEPFSFVFGEGTHTVISQNLINIKLDVLAYLEAQHISIE